MQIFSADNRNTIRWASGTSTEIYIYPADRSFAERNFLFRISTATVEAEESKFTFFEGITRHLMILKGSLELVHEGRYTKILQPFDQDTFSGEWDTRSKGKVTDFNLMLKGGATGSLHHHPLKRGENMKFKSTSLYHFIYLAEGKALVNNDHVAQSGDLIFFDGDDEINMQAENVCEMIEIRVALP